VSRVNIVKRIKIDPVAAALWGRMASCAGLTTPLAGYQVTLTPVLAVTGAAAAHGFRDDLVRLFLIHNGEGGPGLPTHPDARNLR